MGEERTTVAVGGRQLTLSNLDKVLYPQAGFSKAAVIDYYARVAPHLLPHVAGRPVTFKRYPDGVDGQSFFEKRCPDHRPAWLDTVRLGREGRDKIVDHCDLSEPAAVVWAANLAALELHVSLARGPDTAQPTAVVFDLDPGAPADVLSCARVALLLRDVFDRLDLVSCVKTSGSKGLQVYVPVNRPGTSYDTTRAFSLAVARLVEKVHGELVVTTQDKKQRVGRVLIDWSQNHLTKTTVAAYSLRARRRPTVSTPVSWDEVADAHDAGDADALSFEAADVLDRVERLGDLFAPVAEVEQALPRLG